MKVETVTLPAFLCSALVNGDTSGLDAEGRACLARVHDYLGDYRVIDVARDESGEPIEPRFTWSFSLYQGDATGGDVLDYVCHVPDAPANTLGALPDDGGNTVIVHILPDGTLAI